MKWIKFTLLAILAALVLLYGSMRFAATYSSTKRTDAEPINVRMGKQRFSIPANFIDAPLEVVGHDEEYRIVRGLLLTGLSPSYEGRSPENLAAFHIPLCCIRVLITPVTRLSIDEVVPKLLSSHLKELQVVSQSEGGGEVHYVVRSPHRRYVLSDMGDLYVRNDHQEITVCNRRDPAFHLINIECHVYSAGPAGMFDIAVPENDPTARRTELSNTWAKIHKWMR